jgi:PIN like domain
VRFFLDNNLPPRLAGALPALSEQDGHIVKHLRDAFGPSTSDEEWITTLAADGDWVIVTADSRIRRSPAVAAAWKVAGLTGFFLDQGWSKATFWDKAAALVRRWPLVMAAAASHPPGACFSVPYKEHAPVKLLR